jgi:hypothetical protein
MIHSRNAAQLRIARFLGVQYQLLGDVEEVINDSGHLSQPRDNPNLQAAMKGLGGCRSSLAFTLGLVE